MQRRGERARIISLREIGTQKASSKQKTMFLLVVNQHQQHKRETGESAINVSSVSTPSTEGAFSSSSASKIDFSFHSSIDNNAECGSSDNPKTSSNMDTASMYMMTD